MNTSQTLASLRQELIAANLSEYADMKDGLTWVTEAAAQRAEGTRGELLAAFGDRISWLFSQTKPAWGPISPGCMACGNGGWSCLFINGKCNCRCFYCPTSQDEISVPTTNRLPFSREKDYGDYVNHFDFQGVSISGGEPLLTADKTIRFIDHVRRNSDDSRHLWMYTNGTLLDENTVLRLKDAGLNEIRFDISAKDYDLSRLRLAVGHIPIVTVEIPAIPEDRERLSALLTELHEAGVNHLNLHQLRLTPHNSRFLSKRGYTFLHGEKVTVLESELTALSILRGCAEQSLPLPVNYCSFTYKNQFQRAASRKRNARWIMKPVDAVTESGLIRTMTLDGPPAVMAANARTLSARYPDNSLWQAGGGTSAITVHPDLWPLLDKTGCSLTLTYAEVILSPALSYHHPFAEIRLPSGMKIYAEKRARKRLTLEGPEIDAFERRVLSKQLPAGPDADAAWVFSEFITPGLQSYF
jgi:pyruvate formate-lyase activating enzyme-like uncharacterized protein